MIYLISSIMDSWSKFSIFGWGKPSGLLGLAYWGVLFRNGKVYETFQMADYKVNNCRYWDVTAVIWLSLCREIHWLHFNVWCAGWIVHCYGRTLQINAKCMHFQWSKLKKIFLKWLFSNKVMWSSKCFKIYKISFRMHLMQELICKIELIGKCSWVYISQ